MRIKAAAAAAVEPVIGAMAAAHMTHEILGSIRGCKGKFKLVRVARRRQGQGRGGAEYVQVHAAGFAVVGEAGAALTACVAAELAAGVGRLREEGEGVGLVERVGDGVGHLEAFLVEEKRADGAGVDHARELKLAS